MRKNYKYFIIGIVFSLFFLLITKPFNLGVTPDSVNYIEVARNISEGKGVVDNYGNLVNHWPPLYPLFLGLNSYLFNIDVIDAGLYLNLILALVYASLLILIMNELKIVDSLKLVSLLLVLFSISTTEFLLFTSEGLFVMFLMLTLYLFVKWIKLNSSLILIFVGISSGFLFLTRYAGVAFIGSICLYILFLSNKIFKVKLLNLCIYLVSVFLIIAIWITYTLKFPTTVVDRTIGFHIISFSKIKFGFHVFYDWFFYNKYFFGTIVFLTIFFLFKVNKLKLKKNNISFFNFLFIGTYIIFLLISISFFDAHTPLDYRILMPIYPMLILLIVTFFNYYYTYSKLNIYIYIILSVLLLSVCVSSVPVWKNHFFNGQGFSGKKWKNSGVVDYLKQHQNLNLYTNATDALRFFTRLQGEFIPIKYYPNIKQYNMNYEADILKMKGQVINGTKQILYFESVDWRDYLMSEKELFREFKDFEIISFKDGFLIK
ncbi:glycosyltransferase family 39 protein [Mangrovimonas sp. YM274]|uniref:glycosyltransferase family 39 protein n=1 Tax=Mangrovimonas sp. YM274 TaxID=3070660 RepID=UPI0027DC55BF|nr:glycosyltransferase family 39 protein [Mangrovimonas sp. YM274]WMI69847.1 glycosyltransferase family 39 protein [Mangrovimonas sp. YM274]